jgi:hypothetical protein
MNRRLQKSLLRSLPATALALAFSLVAAPAAGSTVDPLRAATGSAGSVRPSAIDDATTEPSVSLDVDTESAAVDDDDPLRLTVTVDNTTLTDLPSGRVLLTSGSATIGSRESLHAHLDGSEPLPTPTTLVEVSIPPIVAGTSFTSGAVVVPHERLTMPADYGAVPVTGAFSAGSTRVDGHGTYVAAAEPPSNSIGLALAMPVTAPTGQDGMLSAESLATYTAPGGVLTRQLDGASGRTVTLAVDPMIVASIRALGADAPSSALAWLERLGSIANDTFPLQYADADGAVQAAAGLDTLLVPTSLDFGVPQQWTAPTPSESPAPDPSATADPPGDDDGDQPEDAAEVRPSREELLAFEWTFDGVLWPAEGTVTDDALDVFSTSGMVDTIVSTDNVAEEGTIPAASSVGDSELLVSDSAVSSALRDAAIAVTASDFADAVALLSAEIAVTARESGATGHTILATLDRGWPPTSERLAQALDAALSLPTVEPTSVADVRGETRTETTLADVATDSSRSGAVRLLLDREQQLTQFSTVLTAPEQLTGRERAQILSLLSVNWVTTADEWTEALVAHNAQSTGLLGSVSILNPSDVLLVGNESAIPFGVRNDSPYDVRVEVEAFPSSIRLDVGEPQTVEVAAGSRQTVRIPVKAQLGNGDVGLTVTIASTAGVSIGAPVTATVAVRADWEGIGAVIAVLLIVGMLVAGIVRTVLRRRARRDERRSTDADASRDDSAGSASHDSTADTTGDPQ